MNRLAFLIICVLLLVSCGGGDNPFEGPITPLEPNFRTYKVGDEVTYEVLSPFGTSLARWRIIGTRVNRAGRTCLLYEITGSAVNGGPLFQSRSLIFQDSSGVYSCGRWDFTRNEPVFIADSGDPDPLKKDIKLWIKDPVEVGFTQTGSVTYEDGAIDDCTLSVDITQVITTAKGRFDTFRVNELCTFTPPTGPSIPSNRVHYLAPQIYYIRSLDLLTGVAFDMVDFSLVP